jgi:hypothetical protein
VLRLIAGPKLVFICDECVAAQKQEPHEEEFPNRGVSCSFVAKNWHRYNILPQVLVMFISVTNVSIYA